MLRVWVVLILSGCTDVLAGSWISTQAPSGAVFGVGVTYESTLIFSGGENVTNTTVLTNYPSQACAETRTLTGTYAANDVDIQVTYTGGTTAISACADATQDEPSVALAANTVTQESTAASGTYTVSGNTLTFTAAQAGAQQETYTKKK